MKLPLHARILHERLSKVVSDFKNRTGREPTSEELAYLLNLN